MLEFLFWMALLYSVCAMIEDFVGWNHRNHRQEQQEDWQEFKSRLRGNEED